MAKSSALATPKGNFNEPIAATIKDKLGRDATAAELEYFGKQMESGNLDAYGLQEFIQGTTEYQTKFADTARTKLAGELGAIDESYLGKVGKQLESKYAQQGRQGSSAFGTSLIRAGKDLATQRGSYLADIGYQSALRGQEGMKADYQKQLQNMYAGQQGLSNLGSESRNRYYSTQDYNRQMSNEERLREINANRQPNFLQQLAPGLISGAAQVIASDRRAKENIAQIGDINGQPIYEFNYIGQDERHIGVMSDEVGHIPGAVIKTDNYDLVNYEKVMEHLAKGGK
jgi:hypothetical protein